MGHPAEQRLSWDAYLALERETGVKHEFVDGYVYAMSSGTPTHALLATRLGGLLARALRGKPCKAYSGDLKVWMPTIRSARYPDLSVVCGKPSEDPGFPATTRPTVLFEVLSPSTGRFDGGAKFDEYASIPTLRDYVLVSTTTRAVTHWHRGPDGRWTGARLGPDDTLVLADIDVRVVLADVYEDVELDVPLGPHPPADR
jgi:Uma2 family endonuclease